MTGEAVLATIGAFGGMGTLVVFLQFLNTRKATADKSSTDSYSSYRAFVSSATDDRDREIDRMKAEREILWSVRGILIQLVQDLLTLARNAGVPGHTLDKFQDRLDKARSA